MEELKYKTRTYIVTLQITSSDIYNHLQVMEEAFYDAKDEPEEVIKVKNVERV